MEGPPLTRRVDRARARLRQGLVRVWARLTDGPGRDAPARRHPGGLRLRRSDRRIELAAERFSRGLRTGMQTSPFAGAGSEIRGVRPWVEGDPVRGVDWRVTARRDALHIRTWREERELPVILLLDRSEGLAAVRGGWYADVLSVAARWTLQVAEAAGHPVGVAAFGGPVGRWVAPAPGRAGREAARSAVLAAAAGEPEVRPGAGRGSLQRHLAGAGPAPALEAVTTHHPAEALLVLLSPFDVAPPELDALESALAGAGRRHSMVALWADGEATLSAGGVTAVRPLGEGPRLLDQGSRRVRDRHASGVRAWRKTIGATLARHARTTVRLVPGRDPLAELARAFGPRRRGAGGRPRRPADRGLRRSRPLGPERRRTAGLPLAAVALGALVGGGPVTAQEAGSLALLPGEARVVADTLSPSPILGTPALRRLRVRTVPGARLEATRPRRGDRWDVTATRVRPLAGDTLWEVTQELIPWRAGSLPRPPVAVRLRDAAGSVRVGLEPPRHTPMVRVAAPAPPPGHAPTGSPTWPGVRPLPTGGLWRGVGLLPLLLLGAALLQGVGPVATRILRVRDEARRSRPPGLEGLEALPAREALDRIVEAARRRARRAAGVNPAGWTASRWAAWARDGLPNSQRWASGGEERFHASELAAIVDRADEVRFDPDGDHQAAVQATLPRLRRLDAHRLDSRRRGTGQEASS